MPNIACIFDGNWTNCIMGRSSIAAVYAFPHEDGNGIPVCLTIFSPYYLIEIMEDLCDLINEFECAHYLQLFPSRTEIHFEELDYLSVAMLAEVLTSVSHREVGNWAFFRSGMGVVIRD